MTKKIVDYKVILKAEAGELENEVKTLLKRGWQLQGGVSVSFSESDEYLYPNFAQAMVKHEQVVE